MFQSWLHWSDHGDSWGIAGGDSDGLPAKLPGKFQAVATISKQGSCHRDYALLYMTEASDGVELQPKKIGARAWMNKVFEYDTRLCVQPLG